MDQPRIGITIGDINGIGPEVIIKALSDKRILEMCTPIIYASSKVMSYHKNIVDSGDFSFATSSSAEHPQKGKINVVNSWQDVAEIQLGSISESGGKFAHISMDRAVQEFKKGFLDAIVTAPINKKAMQLSSFNHPGHTEFFGHELDEKNNLMMMVSDDLRVALVTNHLPVAQIAESITKELIQKKLDVFYKALVEDFGIENPIIAVLGLNPHAGDGGSIGTEEEEIIRPVIIEAKKNGKMVMGPFAADGLFGSGKYRKFDGILAMYHDQGLVAYKALSFGKGVNFTAGMSLVRTSPDHGTGFDIVGQNQADDGSFREALFTAIDVIRNRKEYHGSRENKLRKKPKQSEQVAE